MARKALILVTGNALGSILLLVRNLLLARLLTVEHYGIASTFAVSMAIVEMLSQFGLHQMIVQDRQGDDPRVQAAMQGFQVVRGFFSGALLLLVADPYAHFLGLDHVAWAYRCLALIPIIGGFMHFDTHRVKRQMRFAPAAAGSVVPAFVSMLAIWPLVAMLTDYRAMLIALVVQSITTIGVSHLLAERPYRLAFDRDLIRRGMRFGWPLMLNTVLLFAVLNGEKLVVGRELGMAALAIFSMGFSLTLTPTLVLAGSAQQYFLPQLSAAQDAPERFRRIGAVTMQSSLVIGLLLVLGTIILGPPLITALLGEKYLAVLPLLPALAVMQAARVAKAGSAVVALSKARTGNAMVSNLPRVASLALSWWVAIHTGDLLTIIWIATAGEVTGYAISLWLVNRRCAMPLRPMLLPVALTALAYLVTAIDGWMNPPQPSLGGQFHAFQIVVVVACLAALASMRDMIAYLLRARRRP